VIVKDVMKTRNLVSARPDDDLAMAAQMMRWAGVRHLPVLDDRRVVGVITERDLLRYRAETGGTGGQDPVARFMTPEPEVVAPDDPLAKASGLMVARRIGCLPVVEEGELVGMLTATDVLALPLVQATRTGPSLQPRVEVAMKRNPATVPPYYPLLEAVGIMVDRGIRHVTVVDDNGRVVGILSDRDVRTALGDPLEALHQELPEVEELKVSSVMTTDVTTVTEDTSLADAARHFIDERIGALPVLSAEGALVGILSYVDVIRALQESLSSAAA
jgi:CBS domain-containing protein